MKKIFKHLDNKVEPWNLFIGIAIGFGLGLFAYNCLTPYMFEHKVRTFKFSSQAGDHMMGNVMVVRGEPFTIATHTAGAHMAMPVTMKMSVDSDKQFLQEMITHHEDAVRMSQHVLTLNPREDVKTLANDIISSQSDEIRMMKKWLEEWDTVESEE